MTWNKNTHLLNFSISSGIGFHQIVLLFFSLPFSCKESRQNDIINRIALRASNFYSVHRIFIPSGGKRPTTILLGFLITIGRLIFYKRISGYVQILFILRSFVLG